MSIKRFDEKVAVITGGGSGIGQELACQLGAKGCNIALVDVNRKGMQETRKKLSDTGVKVTMPVDKAAKKILKAVRKDKMRVVIGADALLFEGAKRAMPDQVHKLFLLAPKK
jgi:short-subunit dehydrogenase